MTWSYLFEPRFGIDGRQNSQIRLAGQEAGVAMDTVVDLSRALDKSNKRIAKLELTLEALVRLLGHRSGLRPEELALMIQRVDLADGVEDGAMGPDVSARAPKCGACGRPVNPARSTCIYCNTAIPKNVAVAKAPSRSIQCVGCGTAVPESESYFSETGVVCGRCFAG